MKGQLIVYMQAKALVRRFLPGMSLASMQTYTIQLMDSLSCVREDFCAKRQTACCAGLLPVRFDNLVSWGLAAQKASIDRPTLHSNSLHDGGVRLRLECSVVHGCWLLVFAQSALLIWVGKALPSVACTSALTLFDLTLSFASLSST